MRHFQMEEWVDFIRGVVDDTSGLAMREHLTAGCRECAQAVAFLTRLAEAAQQEQECEAGSVKLASEAVSAFTRPGFSRILAGLDTHLRTLVATLKYDSSADWQTAGARGIKSPARHLLFEVGDYVVDVRLDRENGRESLVAIGQVAHRRTLTALVASVPVRLFAGNRLFGETKTNGSGEFLFEYPSDRDLTLVIPLQSAGEQIQISVGPLDQERDHVRTN